jgi:hypothetical protein
MPRKKRKGKHASRRANPAKANPAKRRTRRHVRAARPNRRSSLANPVIGDSALELSYAGGEGKRKGKLRGPWKHDFESNDVEVRGRKDGSIVLRSKTGKRLWDFFEV